MPCKYDAKERHTNRFWKNSRADIETNEILTAVVPEFNYIFELESHLHKLY